MATYSINLEQIKEMALVGVRRAAVFMGFGLNAANLEDFNDFDLTKLTFMQVISPDEVDEKLLNHYKEEFRHWIIAGGLRELSETFCVFLDEIYKLCFVVSRNPLSKSKYHGFHREGLKEKLCKLEMEFSVKTERQPGLLSIHHARNCITHRRGYIGLKDCINGQPLKITWTGLDLLIDKLDGELIHIEPPIPTTGLHFEAGESIIARSQTRVKVFNLGEYIQLSARDLMEITEYFTFACTDIANSFIEFAQKQGVEIRRNGV